MNKIGTEQRFATRWSQNSARCVVQPIDCATGHVLAHSLYAIVIGPAIVTIEIAFPLREKIRDDGLEISGTHTRLQIRKEPTTHVVQDLGRAPLAFAGAQDGLMSGDVGFVKFMEKFGM